MQNPVQFLPLVYLPPCAMHFGDAPAKVSTILGSCVSVTLYSPEYRIGAICHALLPTAQKSRENDFRYVDSSIRRMIARFAQAGVSPLHLVARLFGGSEMLAAVNGNRKIHSVGRQNIDSALSVLKREKLVVTAMDVGGFCGRKLVFFTHTGEVLTKRNNPPPAGAQWCIDRTNGPE